MRCANCGKEMEKEVYVLGDLDFYSLDCRYKYDRKKGDW